MTTQNNTHAYHRDALTRLEKLFVHFEQRSAARFNRLEQVLLELHAHHNTPSPRKQFPTAAPSLPIPKQPATCAPPLHFSPAPLPHFNPASSITSQAAAHLSPAPPFHHINRVTVHPSPTTHFSPSAPKSISPPHLRSAPPLAFDNTPAPPPIPNQTLLHFSPVAAHIKPAAQGAEAKVTPPPQPIPIAPVQQAPLSIPSHHSTPRVAPHFTSQPQTLHMSAPYPRSNAPCQPHYHILNLRQHLHGSPDIQTKLRQNTLQPIEQFHSPPRYQALNN